MIDNKTIMQIAESWACEAHRKNHYYNDVPYELHLSMVVGYAKKYLDLIPNEQFHPTIIAACWAHDTIEDTRKTYNEVKRALGVDVAEIVFALTNEKGKTRKERANEKYYTGIKNTAGATFVKLCDRLANVKYSSEHSSGRLNGYRKEYPSFKASLFEVRYTAMFQELDLMLS